MEPAGAMNWTNDDADFMAQLLGSYPFMTDDSSPFWPLGMEDDHSLCYNWQQGSSSCNTNPNPSLEDGSYYTAADSSSPLMYLCPVADEQSAPIMLDHLSNYPVNGEPSGGEFGANAMEETTLNRISPKRKFQGAETEKNAPRPPENPKKKSRGSGNVPKSGRNSQSKRTQKVSADHGEESNAGLQGQSSCSYSSEDDSNASQELNEGAALNLNGKTRASRGSATDPQSLYARKRRERINERLRILQNLVPNGTKVDISTMLEEAVQYVKFLQLQIKLLSSDDLWMYAPIAYNGLDIGLDLQR